MIRPAATADAPQIAGIYNHHVRETVVTFEEQPVADEEMARRIAETTAEYPWLVSEIEGFDRWLRLCLIVEAALRLSLRRREHDLPGAGVPPAAAWEPNSIAR